MEEYPMRVLLLAVIGAAALSCQVISNESVSARFAPDGALAELRNVKTGHAYVAGGVRAPWRMMYRSAEALDLEIEPDGQKAEVRRVGESVVLRYGSVIGKVAREGRTKELRVSLEVKAALAGDRLVWTARIVNREPGIEVTELWLPWLGGIGDLGNGAAADVLYWPERAGRRIPEPRRNVTAPLRLTYPFPAGMQWFTLNNGEEGLYIGSHDESLMTTCLQVEPQKDGRLAASVVKYPFVAAGETWDSPAVVTRLYSGDWHAAAKTYRAWADTWMRKPDPPAWLKREPGWVLPLLKGQSGHIMYDYADLPRILKEAQSVGINLLNVFGWVKQGFDNLYPEYDPDEAMGGAEGMRQAMTAVRAGGGRAILYTQGQLIDPSTKFYREKGHRIVARDIWGYEYRESYGGTGRGTLLTVMRNKYFGVACPGAMGWIDQLLSQYELVKRMGGHGIIFDQMGGIPPYICYSKEHPHAKPSLAVGPNKVANMKRLRETIKRENPDFLFVIELGTDCYAGLVDIIHSHGVGFWPEPGAFGEMLRYTFPEPLITNRGGGPYDRKMQLGHAFALGWRFDSNLRDVRDPELAKFLKRMCELRAAHADLLLEGRFVDNEGFTSDNENVSAHAFVNGDRMAVTLWNPTPDAQQVTLRAPGYQVQAAEKTGNTRAVPGFGVEVVIFRKGI